ITFAGSINNTQLLAVSTAGAVTFGGPVGDVSMLSQLTVNAGSILMNGGGVTTDFGQTYTGQMTLGAAATFNRTGGGTANISFGAIVGGFPLTSNDPSSGSTAFNGNVGVGGPLQSIMVNGRVVLPS